MSNNPWAIGIDIGGTKIKLANVDSRGVIHPKSYLEIDSNKNFAHQKKEIVQAVHLLQQNSAAPPIGIGIGIAGQVEAKTGLVHYAPNLQWRNIPLKAELEQATKLPVAITNDVRAALWGEWLHGAGKGYQDLICVFIGTGIGGGIVSGGKILEGHKNSAGEIGHITLDLNGSPCTCGNIGCFEAHAGGWAIAARAEKALSQNIFIQSSLKTVNHALSGKDVIDAAHAGDTFSQELVQEAIRAMGAGITSLVNAFNPECVILGGGIIHGLPEAIPAIKAYVERYALKIASSSLKITPGQLRASAGTIGAATFAIHTLKRT